MLKPEIRDPQGEAIVGACHRLGFTDVVAVRQGKRFEVEIADAAHSGDEGAAVDQGGQVPAPAADPGAKVTRVAELAAELLANPIIEEFSIRAA